MKKKISWLIFIAFLVLVEVLWGWGKILAPWKLLSMSQVLTGVVLLFTTYSIRTLRLYDYFLPDVSWWASFRLMLMHNFMNNMLPARMGEVSFPLLLKQYFSIGYLRSTSVLLWFRLLDLHAILMMALIFWPKDEAWPWPVKLLIGLMLLVPWFVYLLKAPLLKRLQTLLQNRQESKLGKLLKMFIDLIGYLPNRHSVLLKSLLLTWLNWAMKLFVLAWFISLFINEPVYRLIVAAVAGELTSILPVHAPGGFGTYEAGLMAGLIGFADQQLAATTAINTHLFLLSSSLLGYVVAKFIPIKQS